MPNDSNEFSQNLYNFQTLVETVRKNIAKATAVQKKQYDAHHRPESFHLGDSVLVKEHTLSNKDKKIVAGLAAPFSKPAVITKILTDLSYEVTFPDGAVRGPVHISLLRRYHHRDCSEHLDQVALDAASDLDTSQSVADQVTNEDERTYNLRPRGSTNYRESTRSTKR